MLLLAKKGTISLGVGIIDNDSIDRVGIREANRQAMQAALFQIYDQEYIKNKTQIRIMIDGRDKYSFDIPQLPKPEYIVRGDSRIKQIMAASIVAKVTRDTLMQDIEKEFP